MHNLALADPQPQALPAAIAPAEDRAYPGTLRLEVDATDTDRGIFRVRQTIPVDRAGAFTLLYPKWLPGHHSPSGPVDKLAGLVIKANGTRLDWTRDTVDVYAFHVTVPEGVSTLDLEYQFLSPRGSGQGRKVMTPDMLNLQWNTVALYPAGYFARGIPVEAHVKFPAGWQFATALDRASSKGDVVSFKPVSFEKLIDSPIFAGRYFKSIDLDPQSTTKVRLNIVADRPEFLAASDQQIAYHRAMVTQAYKLFKSQPYDHYDFLFALSNELSGIGLEHHQSSENGVEATFFTEWDKSASTREILPHEFTHAWNGKFRRGADLWTPTFNEPMRDSLLWVYEGQTQYWGAVLNARSGLISKDQALQSLALIAATYDHQLGRVWRTLEDTTNDPIIANRNSMPWSNWQRREDYYNEGLLIWLDADTLIREMSNGKRSLDDFASSFFGIPRDGQTVITYVFDDVVAALNKVQPYDWATFLKARVEAINPKAPLDGLKRGGYQLVYGATPSAYLVNVEAQRKYTDLRFSLGLTIAKSGAINSVMWDSAAFNAGLTVGLKIIAVNGRAYDPDQLKTAITAAKNSKAAIDLLIQDEDRYRTVKLSYFDGLRYPQLQRVDGTPARLDEILAARK
ncbi:M61 family metallopeptidase [Govanella unica]|uniref:Peptidase M61 n=1 Tax=Govanella unica TaxID=2975056 RepID=A0A9X3TXP4_9PROT|nr:peptidase M61 [Govania unica]